MPTSSIVFDPELAERELDKQAQQVNETFNDAAQDIPASFDVDDDALTPAGVGGGGGGGVGGGAGQAGAIAGLTSRIPKPVAGITAAAAMPIALAGGVGMGILSQMASASARMQTSMNLLQVAADNFFRAPGDVFDEYITRPLAKGLLDQSLAFQEMFRDANFGGAAEVAVTGVDRRTAGLQERATGIIGSLAGAAGGAWAGAKAGGALGGALGSVIPGAGTAAGAGIGATGGALLGGAAGLFGGGRIATALSDAIGNVDLSNLGSRIAGAAEGIGQTFRQGASDFADEIRSISPRDIWTGAVELGDWLFSGSVALGEWLWSGSIGLGKWMFNGAINWGQWMFNGAINWGKWMFSGAVGLGKWMFSGAVEVGSWLFDGAIDIADYVTGGVSDTVEDTTGFEYTGLPDWATGAEGGRVTSSGLARIHKGETIADPDRLVSDLAEAIDGTSGGRQASRASVDTSDIESKLDELNRNVRRLASALSVEGVGPEEIARLASDGQTNRVGDTNPRT